MSRNFLESPNQKLSISAVAARPVEDKPNKEPVKLLIIGSCAGVKSIIHTLHVFGFAEVWEWSPFLPTQKPGEVMSILVKYIPHR